MKIDEAIKHCEEKAKELSDKAYEEWGKSMTEEQAYACNECAKEHEQLAKWLKELKKYRAIFENVGKILADNGYTIDDLDTIFEKVNRGVNADGKTEDT